MKKSMNKVFLMGNLGADPELKISQSGKPYARLRVATHRSWQNAQEVWETKTDWHSVFVWGDLAQRCCHNMKKGGLVFVEGSLTYWQVAQTEGYKNAIHGYDVKYLFGSNPATPEMPTAETLLGPEEVQDLDNPAGSRNHNAVAHPA